MTGMITEYLSGDHERLDQLLHHSLISAGGVDEDSYHQFRQGILRHIGIEEKILIPFLQPYLDDTMKKVLERIKLDHSAIVALLVPTPSKQIVAALAAILTRHNDLEEDHGGFYERADTFDPPIVREIVERMKKTPEVKSLPNNPNPKVLEATRRALERAGYDPEIYLHP